MTELITPDSILPVMNAANKHRAIDKLCRFAAARTNLHDEVVRRAVMTREDLTTFGVGRGVAIPHGTVPGISKPLGAFARLKRPVDFSAADGRAADLVFLLLAPESDPSILLRALSCVARRLRDREIVEHLRVETGTDAIHVILTSDSWRGHDSWKHAA